MLFKLSPEFEYLRCTGRDAGVVVVGGGVVVVVVVVVVVGAAVVVVGGGAVLQDDWSVGEQRHEPVVPSI